MSNSTLAAGNTPVAESIRRAVSRYAAAWLAGDRETMLASYHDDFTLHYFGRNPLAGVHGKTAEVERLLVYSVRDELLWQCWVYDQDQALVDTFLA